MLSSAVLKVGTLTWFHSHAAREPQEFVSEPNWFRYQLHELGSRLDPLLTDNPIVGQSRLLPPPVIPKLKTEQRPQGLAMIGLARPMLIEQSAHEGGR